MKRVVINNCFGGFSISALAVKRIAEIRGRPCYFFKIELSKWDDDDRYEPITLEETSDQFAWHAFDIINPNEVLAYEKHWHTMSMEEKQAYNKIYESHELSERDIERDDPVLIMVIEELGEKANGRCAELKIIEIPEDVEWEIQEYDGNEHIAEKHRTWS